MPSYLLQVAGSQPVPQPAPRDVESASVSFELRGARIWRAESGAKPRQRAALPRYDDFLVSVHFSIIMIIIYTVSSVNFSLQHDDDEDDEDEDEDHIAIH